MKRCPVCGEMMTERNGKYFCKSCGNQMAIEPVASKSAAPQAQAVNPSDLLEQLESAKTKLIDKCSLSVTRIEVVGEGAVSSGTGWCGYKNCIITNAHVVADFQDGSKPNQGRITCEFSDKLNLGLRQKMAMVLVYFNPVEDIAILVTPRGENLPSEVPVLKIISEPTKQGEYVFTIGNPLHYKFTYTEGTVANPNYRPNYTKKQYPVLQTTMTLNHGNSGGPVFNAKGDIVGMTTFSELQQEVQKTFDPINAMLGGDGIREEQVMKEIAGYGFCVSGKAITDAILEIL